MRTVKLSALLSGFCGIAVALGILTSSAHALVTTERGASILAFPKVLSTDTADTIIQIANTSNNMVHARCFYVNAAEDSFGQQQWQVTDFHIWLTKQQPTSWQVSTGRFVNQGDSCEPIEGGPLNGLFAPAADCAGAGIDPGAIPPVAAGFTGELKCVEVDVSNNPLGGNHLKGEATIKTRGSSVWDTAKYNAIGILGTAFAGETGNELLLDQPSDTEDEIGQYNACPNQLIVNHFAELSTDPTVSAAGQGGVCGELATGDAGEAHLTGNACTKDADCCSAASNTVCSLVCIGKPAVGLDAAGNVTSMTSATLTELTLVPCSQNYEDPFSSVAGNAVTVQFEVYNEFEEAFSFSTTIECWKKFFLFQLDAPNDATRSLWAFSRIGTLGVQTRIIPNDDEGGVIGVAGIVRSNNTGQQARTLMNIHMEGDRWSQTGGQIVDRIILSGQ